MYVYCLKLYTFNKCVNTIGFVLCQGLEKILPLWNHHMSRESSLYYIDTSSFITSSSLNIDLQAN